MYCTGTAEPGTPDLILISGHLKATGTYSNGLEQFLLPFSCKKMGLGLKFGQHMSEVLLKEKKNELF